MEILQVSNSCGQHSWIRKYIHLAQFLEGPVQECLFQDDVVSGYPFPFTCVCNWSLSKVVFWSSPQEPSCLHSQRGKQVYVLCIHRVWSWCRNNCSCSSDHSCMMASVFHFHHQLCLHSCMLLIWIFIGCCVLFCFFLCWVTENSLLCDVFTCRDL